MRVLGAAAAGTWRRSLPSPPRRWRAARPPASRPPICGQFGLRGGGYAVDAGGASSLVAVASACLALAAGELDVALAGGVDLSLDPLDLVGAGQGRPAGRGDMRVYDENPTGFLPGEGCGMVLLMRPPTPGRRACPSTRRSSAGARRRRRTARSSTRRTGRAQRTLLAMRRAYERAGVDPADVQLIEGCGAGAGPADDAELTALAALRVGARQGAALGSISANIGNTRAAAGAAGLIKAVLAIANGVLPPVDRDPDPHPMLRDGRAALRLPRRPSRGRPAPGTPGSAATGPDGLAVHLVLRGEPGEHIGAPRRRSSGRAPAAARRPDPAAVRRPVAAASQAQGQDTAASRRTSPSPPSGSPRPARRAATRAGLGTRSRTCSVLATGTRWSGCCPGSR